MASAVGAVAALFSRPCEHSYGIMRYERLCMWGQRRHCSVGVPEEKHRVLGGGSLACVEAVPWSFSYFDDIGARDEDEEASERVHRFLMVWAAAGSGR
ncbi:beta-glucosidase 47-like [Dorcoceras hygrometricum]|uniref:Beta-glucosidase 47-like n=1 Tax=Dorcoceras hygrometricum TaxID=472368 RepID=A0A2Z7CJD1_9LAMI|nr:beta-glucosidase 47-like [Dorcoceras hygrometricum]